MDPYDLQDGSQMASIWLADPSNAVFIMVARDFLISCLMLLLIVDAGVSVRFGVAVLVNALCLVP